MLPVNGKPVGFAFASTIDNLLPLPAAQYSGSFGAVDVNPPSDWGNGPSNLNVSNEPRLFNGNELYSSNNVAISTRTNALAALFTNSSFVDRSSGQTSSNHEIYCAPNKLPVSFAVSQTVVDEVTRTVFMPPQSPSEYARSPSYAPDPSCSGDRVLAQPAVVHIQQRAMPQTVTPLKRNVNEGIKTVAAELNGSPVHNQTRELSDYCGSTTVLPTHDTIPLQSFIAQYPSMHLFNSYGNESIRFATTTINQSNICTNLESNSEPSSPSSVGRMPVTETFRDSRANAKVYESPNFTTVSSSTELRSTSDAAAAMAAMAAAVAAKNMHMYPNGLLSSDASKGCPLESNQLALSPKSPVQLNLSQNKDNATLTRSDSKTSLSPTHIWPWMTVVGKCHFL